MSVGLGSSQLNGRNGAPATSSYVVIGADGALTSERQLTGTANQIIVTDNGAGSTVVLSTPQNIHTAATPTFAGITLSGLTAGRLPIVSTGGLVADDSELLWDATNKVQKIGSTGWGLSRDALNLQLSRTVTTAPDTAPGAVRPILGVYGTFAQSGAVNQGRIGLYATVGDHASVVNKTITGAANNGSGLIRITATSHGFANGDRINVYGVTGTTEANGVWTISNVATNTFDLNGSTFTNAYVSGGTATNRGLYYAQMLVVRPALDRDGVTLSGTGANGDDVAALAMSNEGAGKATDAIWITDASISGGSKAAWQSILATDSDVDKFITLTGKVYTYGIDLSGATPNTSAVPMIKLGSGHNIELDTSTGTKIGTSTSQKLGFFNATPVVQNTSTTDLRTGLINLGFFASGGASPLNLNGGALTAATGTFSTGTITSNSPAVDISQTWNSGGVTFTGFKQNITNTASASASLLFDWQVGGASKLTLSAVGVTTQTAADGNNAANLIYAHGNGSTSVGIASLFAKNSFGTAATPFRTQTGQTVFRLMGGGYYNDTGDATLATERTAHAAAIDFVAGANDWTSTDNGMYVRVRTTPDASTTTAVRALINDYGITIGAALAARGTTNPTNALTLVDGTAPVGTITNAVQLFSASGKLKSADAAGTVGHVVSASAVNLVSPTAPNRTITVDIGGTTYYIHAKTTND